MIDGDETPSDRSGEENARTSAAWRAWLGALANDAEAALAAAMTYGSLDDAARDAWLDALDADARRVNAPVVALYAPLLAVETDARRRARIEDAIGDDAPAPARSSALRAAAGGDVVCAIVTPLYLEFVELLVCRHRPTDGVYTVQHESAPTRHADPRGRRVARRRAGHARPRAARPRRRGARARRRRRSPPRPGVAAAARALRPPVRARPRRRRGTPLGMSDGGRDLQGRCGTCARFVRVVESIDANGEVTRSGECLLNVWPSPLKETATCAHYVQRGTVHLQPKPKPQPARRRDSTERSAPSRVQNTHTAIQLAEEILDMTPKSSARCCAT